MLDFPANPVNGQQFTAAGVTWVWDTVKWAASGLSVAFLPLAGGTMSGPIVLAADPTANLQAATKQYVDGVRYGDNRIINGDFRVDQRNNGAILTPAAGGIYTVDRWQFVASQAGKFNLQQQTFGAPGFQHCLVMNVAGAFASAAGDYFLLQQKIEGGAVEDLGWGATGAQPITLSFWAHSDRAGTHSGAITNGATNRSYPFTFVLAANTWTKIAITIPGDTAGTWTVDNSASVTVAFNLGVGSNYLGPAGAWAGVSYYGATGSISIVATASAHLYLTGVKLEIGSVATPYNRQSLAKSLADCARYYMAINNMLIAGSAASGQPVWASVPIAMRATPTATFTGFAYTNASAATLDGSSANVANLRVTVTAAGTVGYGQGNVGLSAEL
jgi:hypothetical protein